MRRAIVTDGSSRIEVGLAVSVGERMRGLIGGPPGRGLLLPRTRSVHTFGMRRAIDAVLLARDLRVLAVVPLAPRRVLLPRRGVRHVLELDRSPFEPGCRLAIREADA